MVKFIKIMKWVLFALICMVGILTQITNPDMTDMRVLLTYGEVLAPLVLLFLLFMALDWAIE